MTAAAEIPRYSLCKIFVQKRALFIEPFRLLILDNLTRDPFSPEAA